MPKMKKPKVDRRRIVVVDVSHVSESQVAKLYGLDLSTVGKWDVKRNDDGTLDLSSVIPWREAAIKSDKSMDALEKEKLRLQCEKLQGDVDKQKETMISRSEHMQVFNDLVDGWKHYWMEIFKRNLHHFANKPIEALRPLADRLVREAFNNVEAEADDGAGK